MVLIIRRPNAKVAFIGVVVIGVLGGCSNTPPPAIPTSVEQIGQEAKELGQGVVEAGKDAAGKLHDILAEEIPNLDVQTEKLRAESHSLYCAAKAKGAEIAAAVKAEIEKAWSGHLTQHPGYRTKPLDLDGAACE